MNEQVENGIKAVVLFEPLAKYTIYHTLLFLTVVGVKLPILGKNPQVHLIIIRG